MSSITSLDVNNGVVELDGELTLNQAADMKGLVMKALVTADDVRIRFGEVREADLSFLQLLCSAHRSALRLHKKLALEGEVPRVLTETMDAAGYARVKGCKLDTDCSCIWSKLSGACHV